MTLEDNVIASRIKISVDGQTEFEGDFKTLYIAAKYGTFEGPYPLLEVETADGIHVKVEVTPGDVREAVDAAAPVGGQVPPVRSAKPRRPANRRSAAATHEDASPRIP